jgi:SAM-dependent methyltransferase
VPLQLSRPQLFPDDTSIVPASGSPEQASLLADEIELGTEAYLERLKQLSDITNDIYPELMAACRNTVAQALPGRPLRVLDLCCGIGVVTLELLQSGLPVERVTLADLSPELLGRAQAILAKRLGADGLPPIDTVEIDVLVDDLTERLEGKYDLVVTCNTFQHFPRERQAELFGQIQRLLAPSGVFVFESHFKLVRPAWKQYIVDSYQAQLRRHAAPETFVAHAAEHITHFHYYVNLREVYEWLEAAAFGFYECVFRKDEIGIFTAVR